MARWETVQVDGQPMRVCLDAPGGDRTPPAVIVIQHGLGVDRFLKS